MSKNSIAALTTTKTVANSAFWNLLGRAGPILVAFAITPRLVHTLGPSRWGIFTIALSLVGIFGIFDFGIGRALTRAISERVAAGLDAATMVVTGMLTLAIFGGIGGIVLTLLAGPWVHGGLNVPAGLQREILGAIYILCISAPLVIVNGAMWGVIAAYQRFRSANLVNIPIMMMYYIGPLIVLHVWNNLAGVMLVLVGCRLVMTVAYWRICLDAMPTLRGARLDWRDIRPLLRVGGWMTVSNIAWPVLIYMDRFVIASVLSAAAAGYYSTASDLISRFSIVTLAICTSAYPAIAASFKVDPPHTVNLFRHSLLGTITILFPACTLVIAFSHTLMVAWLDPDFATHAAPVLRLLAFGVLANSIDTVVGGFLDGIGRPDLNAKLSLLELTLSVPILIILLRFGIEGAALAWTLRCIADLVMRFFLAIRVYPALRAALPTLIPIIVICLFLPALPLCWNENLARVPAVMIVIAIFIAVVLWIALNLSERKILVSMLKKVILSRIFYVLKR